jgi:peptidoglycan hydrolase-like protein with peptidoglycan-binding domain
VRYGDSGEGVRLVQEALTEAGYIGVGPIDAQFGVATDAAVRYYQAVNGLPITGVVDDATAHALGVDLHNMQSGGRPQLELSQIAFENGAINCWITNHGASGTITVGINFEGPINQGWAEEREYLQMSGLDIFAIPSQVPDGHYRVTVAYNVASESGQADDQKSIEIDLTAASRGQ